MVFSLARRQGLVTPATPCLAAFFGAETVAAGGADAFADAALGDGVFVKEGGVEVGKVFQLHPLNFCADEAFDGADVVDFFGGENGDGVADLEGAAGAADAVDVVFGMLGDIIIDHVRNAGDVEASGGDIGGDEDFILATFEAGEGVFAFALGAIGVEDGDGMLEIFELVGHAVGHHFGARKDDRAIELGVFEESDEELKFLIFGDGVKGVGDRLGGGAALADFHLFGIGEEPFGHGLEFRRKGGGEEESLAGFGESIDDAADLGEEAHIEHAIDFIEDEVLDIVEFGGAVFDEIKEAAWGGDEDIDALLEELALFAVADAPVDEADGEIHEAGEVAEGGFDLGGEFAGGLEDEGAHLSVGGEFGEDWEAEGGGFSRAGLGGAHHIATGENDGKGP